MPRRRGDHGAAAVEFAIISVLLFVILFGILQYGFFFFQLSSTEHALGKAARQVEIGEVPTCADWADAAIAPLSLSGTSTASWVREDGLDDVDIVRGTKVIVTITWEPIRIGAGLVPFPGGGPQTATMETAVDHIGVDPGIWTGDPVGCP